MSKRMKLCDCCLSIADGDHMPPPKADDGIPFVTISDITSTNKIDFSNTMFVPRKYWDKIDSKRKPQVGDILYSVTGSYGVPVYVDFEKAFVFQRHIAILRPNPEIIDGPYLYYILKNPAMLKLVDKLVTGAIQKTLGLESLRNIEIDVPPICEQHKLVSILQEIDAKIDTNNAICAELEAMAKLLYDYWFVQFDFPDENGKPYKSSGGRMVWSEELKREIPEGWMSGTFEDFIKIGNGKDHQSLRAGTIPVYGSGGIMRYADKALYEGESVLMPRKGTLNNIMYVNGPFWTVDTMYYSVMKKPNSAIYMFYSAKLYDYERLNTGTGVPSMTASLLYSLKVVVPPQDILCRYDKAVKAFYDAIHKGEQENMELASLRDFLLPLLMNGQVTFKEADCH